MIIIGEKINATRKQVAAAIEAKDRSVIETLARTQADAGATYLDINGGHPTGEIACIEWLLEIVQATVDLPICLDSANPAAMLAGLKSVKAKPIVNSISLEKDRLAAMLPLVGDHACSVVALLMADEGVPTGLEDRQQRAEVLVGKLMDAGKTEDEIFIDPCFLTLYTEPRAGQDILESIRWIRKRWPAIHISGGVSNASYGLPNRKWINQAYLILGIGAGMDAVITDPTMEGTRALILAAEVIVGRDEMGMAFMDASRSNAI